MEATPKAAFCAVCNKEVVHASGKDREGKDLCGKCFEAYRSLIQRRCTHDVKKDDMITCADCGAKPWNTGRAWRGIRNGVGLAAGAIAKAFVMYTIPSIISTGVVATIGYLIAKKLGIL